MTHKWKDVRKAAAFVAALLFLGSVLALPTARGVEEKNERKKEAPRDTPAKSDPAVEAWVKTLSKKIGDKNQGISASAQEALVAVGEPALPILKKLAESKDDATASAAKRVIARIDRGGRRDPRGPGREEGRDGPDGRRFRGPLDQLTQDLDLSDKQKEKVKEIMAAQETKMRDIIAKAREGGRPDLEKIRETMKTMRADMLKELKDVLNAEQLKKLEKALENGPGVPGGRRGGPEGREDTPREPRGMNILAPKLKALDLSEKVKSKVDEIVAKHDKKVRELVEKATEARQRPDFAEVGKLLAETMKELKGVLTEEQFKQLEKSIVPREPGRPEGSPRGSERQGERRPQSDF